MKLSKTEWGQPGWTFLHSISFFYPDKPSLEDKQAAKSFFTSLGSMLPCKDCQMHYKAYAASHPPEVGSKAALSKWVVELHNAVNIKTNKPTKQYKHVHKAYMMRESSAGTFFLVGVMAALVVALLTVGFPAGLPTLPTPFG